MMKRSIRLPPGTPPAPTAAITVDFTFRNKSYPEGPLYLDKGGTGAYIDINSMVGG